MLLSPSDLAPWRVSVFSLFCFLFRGHSHNDTQDVIMHVIPMAGCDPTSLCCVCFGLVVVVCFFVCLFSVVFGLVFCLVSCWDSSLDCVQVHYQHFCGFRQVDSPACKLQFICLPRLNVCNDLAEAMKALDGKKKKQPSRSTIPVRFFSDLAT